ncbi:helix-turn-helix domain-containing protein [Streptomyces sp. NPDC001530]|uniref:helix-turn-helix domain-containing protein n=1 Tax=Streptomyces sp. NPDC001530 TaxID=3364582 RepID=UPI00367C2E8D
MPDKPKEELTPADKVRIVLVVLHGHTTSARAAGKYKMSADEIDQWIRAYRAGD